MIKNKNIAKDANIDLSKIKTLGASEIVAKKATGSLTSSDFNKVITNTGASDAIVLTLPTAESVRGKSIKVQLTVAKGVSLSPVSTNAIYLGGDWVLNKDLSIAGVIGNYADVYSDGSKYIVSGYNGVVTKEA